ncbi:MAG TPA: protein kinase [Thermoanaerobaculia bacterium]|nr:protein kinase [Thermoanaerobaculia bacterium]
MSQPERLGRYRIIGLLGSGAMGDVYLAEDPQIERRLAIKTVRVGGSDEEIRERKERLLREAKAAGKLIHPHVVTLFDYGEDEGVVYLAFEYVEGEDLRQRIDREPPLTVREALTLIRQTAGALALAHRQSIVHRDIKPANILVTASGDAKVTDFGIAKLRDQTSNLTMSGSIIGTPHYMSPEQIKGEQLDGRSDLFSLGSVLFEILHGDRPFAADSVTTVVYLILHHDPVEGTRHDLPAPLRELARRMLSKDRDERFTRGEQVVEAIDRLLKELPEAHLAAPARGPSPPDAPIVGPSSPAQMGGETYALPASAPPHHVPPTPGTMPPSPGPRAGTSGTVVPTPPLAAVSPTAATAAPPGTATAAPPGGTLVADATLARPARSRAWILAGCIALPLVLAVGGVALLIPQAMSWMEARRTDRSTPSDVSEPGPDDAGIRSGPPRPTGELAAAGDASPVTAEEGAEEEQPPRTAPDQDADEDPEEGAAEDPPRVSRPERSPESTSPESRPQESRPRETRAQETRPPQTRAAQTDDPPPQERSTRTPTSGRSTPPSVPAATETETDTETAPASAPARPAEEAAADPPVEEVPFDRELNSGLRLSLVVEPEETYVLLRSAYDTRFTSVGQAMDYDATKRRGEPLALPSDGVHYVMLRAEGFADHVVKLDVQPGRPTTTYSWTMGRSGQRSASRASQPTEIAVREGITFGDGPRRAKVEVDGEDVGQLRKYQDGKLLRLGPGRHRVVVTQGSQRFELEVEVSAGAASDRQVVTLGSGD